MKRTPLFTLLLPEVSLVAILDADQEGFLRSGPSLIQIMGRAARHINGQVILYGDRKTRSMNQAIEETNRRRQLQMAHNKKHKIRPKTIKKGLGRGLMEIYGLSSSPVDDFKIQSNDQISKTIHELKSKMEKAAAALDFEETARLRDRMKALQIKELDLLSK